MTYRFLLGLAFIIISLFTWWLSGFNFDQRNGSVALSFICNVVIFAMCIVAPFEELDAKVFKNKN